MNIIQLKKLTKNKTQTVTNLLIAAWFILPLLANAEDQLSENMLSACISETVKTAKDNQTIGEIKQACNKTLSSSVARRVVFEKQAKSNPFAILPHKPNYILPVTYFDVNEIPYEDVLQGESFDDIEAKFQISLKFITMEDLFIEDLNVHVGFTVTSWWQSYNSDISAPFRESNYEPELIFNYNKPFNLLGILPLDNGFVSINHQSNGQAGTLSRSWNRIIAGTYVESGNFVWSFKAWYRIPEDEKETPTSPAGDDNPNIEKYMGYGELGMIWKVNDDHNIDLFLRNNLRSDNKGAVQLGWSFPLSKHLRGYVEYFNGYGESLIYYNHRIERIGIGFKLTDWL